jgi:3-methyl-2-oxobutanoate hydroxymethyltransferase
MESEMKDKWTAPKIRHLKGEQKITALTAHDYTIARLVEAAGAQIILVGDSLAMYGLGHKNTLPVTIDEMLHHTAAVARGAEKALVVADMPFMSYQASEDDAIRNAGRFLKEAGADAVKIEGGTFRVPLITRMLQNGIPVMGHIGLTPQSINAMGGYRVQGRTHPEAQRLTEDAQALSDAGVFALVLECLPAELAGEITRKADTPTISIGAGPHCNGQILVTHDILGLYGDFKPHFVKRYADLGTQAIDALTTFRREVESGTYPSHEFSY